MMWHYTVPSIPPKCGAETLCLGIGYQLGVNNISTILVPHLIHRITYYIVKTVDDQNYSSWSSSSSSPQMSSSSSSKLSRRSLIFTVPSGNNFPDNWLSPFLESA
mmetsp:Transcript_678/g.1069  ORF Transcript_678/g.1069 Transcript_678/m.1069 type:complete len:105 (-) Transcript_678:361-675(-)